MTWACQALLHLSFFSTLLLYCVIIILSMIASECPYDGKSLELGFCGALRNTSAAELMQYLHQVETGARLETQWLRGE